MLHIAHTHTHRHRGNTTQRHMSVGRKKICSKNFLRARLSSCSKTRIIRIAKRMPRGILQASLLPCKLFATFLACISCTYQGKGEGRSQVGGGWVQCVWVAGMGVSNFYPACNRKLLPIGILYPSVRKAANCHAKAATILILKNSH